MIVTLWSFPEQGEHEKLWGGGRQSGSDNLSVFGARANLRRRTVSDGGCGQPAKHITVETERRQREPDNSSCSPFRETSVREWAVPGLFPGDRAKPLRVCRADLPLKGGEPLAERIEARVLLLEHINLVLLRCDLLVLRLH